jgi:predicted  nucleic acid-binding Zn-ribbon protein
MFDTIEKLLILQDRDKQIARIKGELAHVEPQRQTMKAKTAGAQSSLDNAKLKGKTLETRRKDLELEMIERYANQQLQTRKNEEYRALSHEIETCKKAIFEIENQEIELMEQLETTQKEVATATRISGESKKLADGEIAQLDTREDNLKKELAILETNREELASAVEPPARARYERLTRSKGDNVVVGVAHAVCGGCHMRLPAQILVTCQAQAELVGCTNCGRILYYSPDMDLSATD